MTTATLNAASIVASRATIPVLAWPALARHGVDAVVTTRVGGVSEGAYATLNLSFSVGDADEAVLENRRRAAAAVGAGLDDLVFAEQVHGSAVAVVGPGERGRGARRRDDAIAGVDALVTTAVGVPLAILVADCAPILLFDPAARVLACVHAGWRGTVARVAAATVDAMAALGSRPSDIVAAIGPAIPRERYQVGDDVVDAARAAFDGHVDGLVDVDGEGRPRFDVVAANRRVLAEAGVPGERILVAGQTTASEETFFSHRRAQPTGRFALVARIRPEAA